MNAHIRPFILLLLAAIFTGCTQNNLSEPILDDLENTHTALSAAVINVLKDCDNWFAGFESRKLGSEPERALPAWQKALKIKRNVKDLSEYISSLKRDLVIAAGGEQNGHLEKRGDRSIASHIMIDQGKGAQLRKKMQQAYDSILALGNDDIRTRYKVPSEDWEQKHFGNGIPLIIALIDLTKVQLDMANLELDMVKSIHSDPYAQTGSSIDLLEAIVIPASSVVPVGDKYKARVLLHADLNNYPRISVNGKEIEVIGEAGYYAEPATSVGVKKWTGLIRIRQTDGTIKEYPTAEQTYTVVPPASK